MRPTTIARRALSRTSATSRALTALELSASFRMLKASGVFDREWYERQRGRHFRTAPEAIYDYLRHGRLHGLSPHLLFEPEWYTPDFWNVHPADPLARYLAREKKQPERSPHPLFVPQVWLDRHPEAAKHPGGVLAHFLATATDDTVMPSVPDARGLARYGELTWGDARRVLLERYGLWEKQEADRTAPRVVFTYDRAADREYVRHWSGSPLPDSGDGPLVSIVLPVFNRSSSVVTAIASVQAQTLENWELLVVDDGSTDTTPQVVALLAQEDPRIKLIRGTHGGVSRARNLAAAQARGRYVAWLDSDNSWHPYFLRTAVPALAASGARGGFASLEMIEHGLTSFRQIQGTLEMMEVGNHIDLNVLVVERSLLDEVGGFDESLRRTVDYDLAWRLWKRSPLVHLPFIGASYDNDREAPDRISVRELRTWTEVVKNRHVIDWDALERDLPARVPGRTSMLVPTWQDWEMTWRMALTVLAAADAAPPGSPGSDIELVILDNGSQRSVAQLLGALAALDPRVKLVRSPVNQNYALGSNLAFAASTGENVVFLNNDTEVWEGWLAPLLAALEDRDVLGAQPLLTYPDGSIQCAGLTFPARGTFPHHFLQHHPTQDATRLGDHYAVPAVTAAALAVRASDVVALQGFDALYANGYEDVDFCLRLHERQPGGRFLVVTTSLVVHHESKTPGRSANTPQNRQVFHSRWAGRAPRGNEPLWQEAGFDVAYYYLHPDVGRAGILRAPQPVVVPRKRIVESGPAAGLPSLRWAIKTAAPGGQRSREWGDVHFAEALAAALERLGQQAAVDFRKAAERSTHAMDDVVLTLRGLSEVRVQPGRTNLLWVISHPELLTVAEMEQYDGVFAASLPWAKKASALLGREVRPLLQATDPSRFRPDVAEPDTGDPVLFLGNSRNVYRPVVRHLVEAGRDVAVYGSRWAQFLPPSAIHGEFVPNTEVPALYRRAGIVLNDHWTDMREEGFMSNRLFDAAAVGARIVSDDVAGTEIFGGLVRTFSTPEELVDLVSLGAKAFPDDEERVVLADQVRREHSFDARARELLDAAVAQLTP